MEWKDGNFDGKTDEEQYPDNFHPTKTPPGKCTQCGGSDSHQFEHVKCSSASVVESQNGYQHKNRTKQRVKKKFDGGIFALGTSPYTDEEIHGQEHHFPKDIEEKKVQREKNTYHTCVQKKEKRKIAFQRFINIPAYKYA